jgi:hypothetical protein
MNLGTRDRASSQTRRKLLTKAFPNRKRRPGRDSVYPFIREQDANQIVKFFAFDLVVMTLQKETARE